MSIFFFLLTYQSNGRQIILETCESEEKESTNRMFNVQVLYVMTQQKNYWFMFNLVFRCRFD